MTFHSGRLKFLCTAMAAVLLSAGVGGATTALALPVQAAPTVGTASLRQGAEPAGLPADVLAAVAAGPIDVFVTVDNATGLRQMRAATRSGLSRASRQAAADASSAAFAAAKRKVLQGRSGVSTKRDYRQLPIQLVHVNSLAALDALASSAGVASISLPKKRTVVAGESNLALIGQPSAALLGATGAGTRVAVIDTGVDYTLAGATTTFGDCTGGPGTGTCRIKQYVDVTASGQRDVDPGHHGTNVSAVVATVASAADLSVYNVFFDDGFGDISAWDGDILDALDQVAASAAATNTRSVNLSLGDNSYNTSACTDSNFTSAFATLRALGVVPVVSAGNSAYGPGSLSGTVFTNGAFMNGISDPACAPGAVSVGAVYSENAGTHTYGNPQTCRDTTSASDQIACFSQTGPLLSILAPGVGVTAAGITKSGTSQAAPHVAAAVAILAAANPAANTASIVNALTSSGPVLVDGRSAPATSVRRLDLVAAVAAVSTLTVPDPPTAATATAGNGSLSATWQSGPSNGGSPVTGYTATASPGGAACATTGAMTCAIAGLGNGTAYTVTVTATNATGPSAASLPTLAVTPLGPPAALAAPTVVAGNAQATVSWTPGDSGGSPTISFSATASPSGAGCVTAATSCTITGLANGTAYTFSVTATNAVGTGAASPPSTAAVPATLPGAPSAPIGSRGDRQVTVSWSAPADTGGSAVTGYTVVATPGGAACSTLASSCAITGLVNGTGYTFVVTATNGVGIGAPSALSALVVPATVPGQALKVSAARGHRLAVVTWTAPANGGSLITGYRVVASPGGRSCAATVTPRCTVTGLVNGRAYRFTVTTANAAGAGRASLASAAVVPAPVPGVPSRIVAARGNARANLSWTAPAPNGTAPITGYRVVASPGGRSCTATRVLRCTVTGLVNGRRYEFAVVAINRVGASPPSPGTAAIPATAPGAVRSLLASFPAVRQTVLSWVAPAAGGGLPITRYEVRTSSDNGRTWSRWVSVGVARSATIVGLLKGRAYLAEVRAVTGVGAGGVLRLPLSPTR